MHHTSNGPDRRTTLELMLATTALGLGGIATQAQSDPLPSWNEGATKAQWEFAARGGPDGEDDWSSAFDADGKPIANTWQGLFPVLNTEEDGYRGTAPVGCFKPNGYGLYDMIGNVWEWTNDWYRPGHSREAAVNPAGPELISLRASPGQSASRVIKGGSHLCAHNYCARYRPAARQPQEADLSAAHLGFRTVLNGPGPGSESGRPGASP